MVFSVSFEEQTHYNGVHFQNFSLKYKPTFCRCNKKTGKIEWRAILESSILLDREDYLGCALEGWRPAGASAVFELICHFAAPAEVK